MPVESNRLQKLAQRFEALPRQQELKQAKIQLVTTAQKVGESADSLKESFDRITTLREMQGKPDLLGAEISQTVKKLRTAVQVLAQQIQPAGVSTKLTAALDNLGKTSKAIADQIAQSWDAADAEILNATQVYIELTGKYDSVAQRNLQQALNRFKNSRNPDGQDAVVRYRAAREDLQLTRTALNIPGNVGKFLSDSARGTGSIQALLDPEIQAFLAEHPALWTQLTVKLS
jgi:hypothetical protein